LLLLILKKDIMNSKIFKSIGILSCGLLLLCCSDEFVDTKPIVTATEESFYSSMVGAEMATTVCYSNFCMEKLWDLTITMTLGSIASDEAEAAAGGKTDVVEFQHIDLLRHTPAEANVFDWSWGYLYRTIGYCNVAIEKLPKISEETDPNFDAELINKRLGEVRFLRALNYFTLTQIYGGVPLVDHVLTPSEYEKGRNTIAEIYGLIKSDLRVAIGSLPEKSDWGAGNVGRASKGAAKGLMAKVYLYESSYAKYHPVDERFTGLTQRWDSALYWAEQVINSGEYKLVGIDGERFDTWRSPETGGYQWIFMVPGNNSSEGVFEIQNSQDGQNWFDTRGTALCRWTAPRKIREITNPTQDGVDFGWGWWSPSNFLANSYEPGDPRKTATILTEEDSILCSIASDGGVAWRHVNFNILKAATGIDKLLRKYECSYYEYWEKSLGWQDGPIHVKLMRYADVVLWAAEAALESGNNDKALQYINWIRTRARMSGNSGVPADLTGTITHDQIVKERLVELGCEGHRFFDLVRWNLGPTYLNHTLADGDVIIYESPKHDFFPIPDKEIALSGNKLKQYPGW
jgi:hypothetical protein